MQHRGQAPDGTFEIRDSCTSQKCPIWCLTPMLHCVSSHSLSEGTNRLSQKREAGMRRMLIAMMVPLVSLIMVAAGCGAGHEPSGGGLEGVRWTLDSYSSGGRTKSVPQGASVDALFERGKVSGRSGVNTYSGPYEVSGSDLTIGRLATTMMAGPPELMDLEKEYLANLEKVATSEAGADILTLFGRDGARLLSYSKGKAPALTGVTWNVVNYYNGKEAIVSVTGGATLTAFFGTDGNVRGSAGINDYSATYETDGSRMKVGPPMIDTEEVDGNPALAQQEVDYLAAIQLTARYEIQGDTLKLFRKYGGLAVTYQKPG